MSNPWENDPIVQQPQSGIEATPLPRNPYEVDRDNYDRNRNERNDSDTREDRDLDNTRSDKQFAKSLRDEYYSRPMVQAYPEAIRQYKTGLYTPANAAGDQALVTAFAKLGDPNSAVQQGEAERVESIQSRKAQIIQTLKREFGWDGAGSLKPQARDWLRESMHNSMKGFNDLYNFERQQARKVAEMQGVDPDVVVLGHAGEPFKDEIQKYWDSRTGEASNNITGFTDPDAEEKTIPIPKQMQQEHFDWVRNNWGNITDENYIPFRNSIDRKNGFTPGDYSGVAENLNQAYSEGQLPTPEGVAIPPLSAKMTGQDRFNNSVFGGDAGSFIFGAGDLTGGADEMAAGARSLINGTPYETELDIANATKNAARENNPGLYLGGQVTSGLATGYGAATLFPKATAALQTPVGMYGAGGTYGTLAGALEDNENRARGGGIGLASGLGGTALGDKVVAPGLEWAMRTQPGQFVSEGVRNTANRMGMNIAPQNAPNVNATSATINRTVSDYDAPRRNLEDAARLGLPYSVADSSPELRALGGSVTRRSVGARGVAENTLEPRTAGRGERAIDGIRSDLSVDVDIPQQRQKLTDASTNEAAPLYNQAYAQPAPNDPRIASLVNTPAGSRAMREARELAANEGKDLDGFGIGLDARGNPVLQEARPSYETLDYVNRGISADIRNNANPMTGVVDFSDPRVRSLEGYRQRFVSTLDELNPYYGEARAASAPYLKAREALGLGANATNRRVSPNEMRVALEGMDDLSRENYGYGYATQLVENINNKAGGDPYRAVYGSPNQQEKISTLFPDGAPNFTRRVDLEKDMGKLTQETLGGSPTAGRLQADAQLDGGTGNAVIGALGEAAMDGGSGIGLLNRMGRGIMDRYRTGPKNAEAVAPDLFNTDPDAALAMLNKAQQDALAIEARRAGIGRRVGLFGAVAAPQAALSYSGS